MNSSHKLTIKNLSKTFKSANLEVLKNVSLHVEDLELVSIVGPSGCGKSTLLDCIAGLTKYDKGEILLYNNKSKANGVSYMMQDDNLLPWRTVIDNVILPLEIAGVSKEAARSEAKDLMHVFGLDKFSKYYPFMLSGGMRQRASLLRTYLGKKDLLLLDEPFSKLDAITRKKMQEWFLSVWQKNKKSVLFVTHDVDEAVFLSDRVYVMSQRPGRIVDEVVVDLPRPRTREIFTDKKFIVLKRRVLQSLG